jgi:hypothetical protein
MKKHIYFLFGAIIFIALGILSASEVRATPCLKYYWVADSIFTNPDSVMIDTCDFRFGIPLEEKGWAKRFFLIKLKYNIIPRNYLAPPDTIIEYSWQKIDSIYTQARNEFQSLENRYCSFHFREYHPEAPDTTIYIPRHFFIRFDNFVKITEADSFIETFSCVETSGFASWPKFLNWVLDDEISVFNLFPNPTTSKTTIIFGIEQPANVSLKLTDMLGNQITLIENQFMDSGSHSYDWDASGYPAGVYYYVLNAGGYVRTGKVVVVR